jgi:hypothetical protein
MDVQSYDFHTGPGRRLAKGCTRGDTLLALFGFASHMFLFMAIGAFIALRSELAGKICFWFAGAFSIILLVIRGSQVGTGTTKESIEAIKAAWNLDNRIKVKAEKIYQRLCKRIQHMTAGDITNLEKASGLYPDPSTRHTNHSIFWVHFKGSDTNSATDWCTNVAHPLISCSDERDICEYIKNKYMLVK